ncbi:MAG: DNA cytosine methyltransferase [Sphingobium sp.]
MAAHSPGLHPARDFACIDLCAGAHGLGLGVSLAVPLLFPGFRARSVCHVEREVFAAATLVGHMDAGTLDQAPVWSDLATFDGRPWRGRVHCVTSGDPCQPNSVAGKGRGADDERFLIDQVVRVVDEVRPLCVLRENVTGNAAGQLAAIVPPLEGLGYRVECGIFSSGRTGNSHGRKRLIILAYRPDIEGRLYAGQWRPGEGARGAGGAVRSLDDAECAEWGAVAITGYDQRTHCVTSGRNKGSDRARVSDAELAHPHEPRLAERISEEGRCGTVGHEGPPAGAGRGDLGNADGDGGAPRLSGAVERAGPAIAVDHGDGLPVLIPGPADPRWADLLDARPDLLPAYSPYDRFAAAIRDAGFAPDGRPLTRAWQKMAQGVGKVALAQIRAAVFQKTAQSHLRHGSHAVADRVDRLRLLGNGVDPVVAAYAWLCLDARHRASGTRADGAAVRAAA